MTWISVHEFLPESGKQVLTLKKYLLDSEWSEPEAVVDRGWETYSEHFRWENGGHTSYWMEIPQFPIDA